MGGFLGVLCLAYPVIISEVSQMAFLKFLSGKKMKSTPRHRADPKSASATCEEKGRSGEEDLNAWLQANGLAYLYVRQNPETFAPLFKGFLKRPDFLVLFDSIGLIAVDAKNHTRWKGGYYTLPFESELRRVIMFERLFRIPVWYAYRHEEKSKIVWYWISALKAIEVGKVCESDKTGEFLEIKLEHFEKIETNADLGKLYTQRLPSLVQLSSL